jgi:Ca2+ transporting ATPase
MTIFNFLNARVLNDKINILADIFSNPLFSIIVAGIAVMQVLLITFGGIPFSCYYWVIHLY